ncbi:hypothetical protein EJ07DRAFT_164423 [Lizonia empirigonia]|nr:hypothetical protein EJ07DRAFT_164423 [Lizonia empirigonia]
MFKPLSTAYKRHLTDVLHNSQGLLQIRKGDFFPIFWAAWKDSFTVANIQKSFEATGIEPKDPGVVLQRFTHTPPPTMTSITMQIRLLQQLIWAVGAQLLLPKKRNKPNRILELEKPQEDEGESQFFTASKFDHARDLHTAKEQQKHDKEAEKVMNQQLRDANKAYKLKIHQEKLETRRVAKVEQSVDAPDAPSPPPPITTRRGRSVTLPMKYR